MFITAEDFDTIPYNLPDLNGYATQFSNFVAREEREELRRVLGSVLYQEFIEGLFTDGDPTQPIAEEAIEQKWKDLRDGAMYTLEEDGEEYTWIGLNELLIPYIYAMWTRATWFAHAQLGIMRPQVENATAVSPTPLIVGGYNDYSGKVGDECSLKDTLYGFLHTNEETYATWVFKCPGVMTEFNI
jgi:hypothetical protein